MRDIRTSALAALALSFHHLETVRVHYGALLLLLPLLWCCSTIVHIHVFATLHGAAMHNATAAMHAGPMFRGSGCVCVSSRCNINSQDKRELDRLPIHLCIHGIPAAAVLAVPAFVI